MKVKHRSFWRRLIPCFVALSLWACTQSENRHRAVYVLLDTSGTYTEELDKAEAIVRYLLGTLESGDSLAVARIDSGSFSEKDIIAKVTFDERPSVANSQKREFAARYRTFVETAKGSPYTDVSGGMLQATEWLAETGAGQRYILVFSDLKEELPEGHVRNFDLPLGKTDVVALNVTKLRSDNVNPQDYLDRVEMWRQKVEAANGNWRMINDLERLDRLLSG